MITCGDWSGRAEFAPAVTIATMNRSIRRCQGHQVPSCRLCKSRLVVAAAIVVPFLWLFGPAIFGANSFVYRDAAHYYYPLYQMTAAQWSAGRVPLWNAQENNGRPLLADPTASVLYPGKALFALPLPFAMRYKLYIVSHILLAAAASVGLARGWGASIPAAGLCGLSYAFSGNVLFQYCNVVFLVGAAWLPLAVLAADRMLVRRSLASALVLSTVLAMMILGGDPQAAYHGGLLAALYAWLLWRRQRRRAPKAATEYVRPPAMDKPKRTEDSAVWSGARWHRRLAGHRLVLILLAAGGGSLLAAVQIIPSVEWTRSSDRAVFHAPRSVYEILGYLRNRTKTDGETPHEASGEHRVGQGLPLRSNDRDNVSVQSPDLLRTLPEVDNVPADAPAHRGTGPLSGLLAKSAPGTHGEQVYDFSVGPWRLAEYVWPNFSGRQFPTHRRWLRVIPAEGRVWTPSLYMGLLPLLLALWSWRLKTGRVRIRWLSWVALLSVIGSFGWYGIGWLLQECRVAFWSDSAGPSSIGPPLGGLYWLMTVVLPGYVLFRYPAKLLVVAALALSVLAAKGWDRAVLNSPRELRRWLVGLGSVSLVGALAALAVRPFSHGWLANVPADKLFGPLDTAGAASDLFGSPAHTTVLCCVFWWLLGRATERPSAKRKYAMLLVTAVDLGLAHGWLVQYAPSESWQGEPKLAAAISAEDTRHIGRDAYRIYRASPYHWQPSEWSLTSSSERQREGLRWDHDTLLSKYHLRPGLSCVETSGSMMQHDYQAFLRVARRHGTTRLDGTPEPHRAVLDALAAKYLILPEGTLMPATVPVGEHRVEGQGMPDHAGLWHNPNHLPRAWTVYHVQVLPPLKSNDPAAVERRTEHVSFPDGHARDWRATAVVESDKSLDPPPAPESDSSLDDRGCRIVRDDPRRVEIESELTRPGLVVLSDLYCGGWELEVLTEGTREARHPPVLRTNRVMRGVYLPAGRHRLVYRYRPWSFRAGAAISLLAWSGLLLLAAAAWRRGHAATSRAREAQI